MTALQKYLDDVRLSRSALARRVGVDRTSVDAVCRGEGHFSVPTLGAVARELDELVHGTDVGTILVDLVMPHAAPKPDPESAD